MLFVARLFVGMARTAESSDSPTPAIEMVTPPNVPERVVNPPEGATKASKLVWVLPGEVALLISTEGRGVWEVTGEASRAVRLRIRSQIELKENFVFMAQI